MNSEKPDKETPENSRRDGKDASRGRENGGKIRQRGEMAETGDAFTYHCVSEDAASWTPQGGPGSVRLCTRD